MENLFVWAVRELGNRKREEEGRRGRNREGEKNHRQKKH
jgi:hypothetical protein